jgi:hypothetical protein
VAERGGEVYTPERLERELVRAELSAIATRHCYEHGARVANEILDQFHITRKTIKEKSA